MHFILSLEDLSRHILPKRIRLMILTKATMLAFILYLRFNAVMAIAFSSSIIWEKPQHIANESRALHTLWPIYKLLAGSHGVKLNGVVQYRRTDAIHIGRHVPTLWYYYARVICRAVYLMKRSRPIATHYVSLQIIYYIIIHYYCTVQVLYISTRHQPIYTCNIIYYNHLDLLRGCIPTWAVSVCLYSYRTASMQTEYCTWVIIITVINCSTTAGTVAPVTFRPKVSRRSSAEKRVCKLS